MPIYRVEVSIAATAYIRAENFGDAAKKGAEYSNGVLIIGDPESSDIVISDKQFTDPELPDVSLSPAMTVFGMDFSEGAIEQVEP